MVLQLGNKLKVKNLLTAPLKLISKEGAKMAVVSNHKKMSQLDTLEDKVHKGGKKWTRQTAASERGTRHTPRQLSYPLHPCKSRSSRGCFPETG